MIGGSTKGAIIGGIIGGAVGTQRAVETKDRDVVVPAGHDRDADAGRPAGGRQLERTSDGADRRRTEADYGLLPSFPLRAHRPSVRSVSSNTRLRRPPPRIAHSLPALPAFG